jgi:DNA-binding transcriptional ArsR family regulator
LNLARRTAYDIIIFMISNIIIESNPDVDPLDSQAQIFKVLAHPARIAILDILRNGEHCVCHMEAHLGLRQAYISQQLTVLREAGLIQDRRDGWNIFYRVADERIYDVLNTMRQITGQEIFEGKKSAVICTCPKCSAAVGGGLK